MGIWAIVPVKSINKGKNPLSEILSDEERATMNITMLGNTLSILRSLPEIEQTMVISADNAVLSMARDYGAKTLQEDGQSNIGVAMTKATMVAKMYNATGLLVLSADIPLLTKKDMQLMLTLGKNPPILVMAPDLQGSGTNAICLNPTDLMKISVGKDSYKKNLEEAAKFNIRVATCQLTSLGLDLDNPDDMDLLRQTQALQV
ncbi:MAG TPA: 2-phospho-L-lactate guanylyltransferase [Bellilinea sp.]|nr:2-phospho-L-lactate guanylyltransferase [Bellilinea sp.]